MISTWKDVKPTMRTSVPALTLATILLLGGRAGAILIEENGLDNLGWQNANCTDFDYRQNPVRCEAGIDDCDDPGSENWKRWVVIPPGDPGYPGPWNPGDAINTAQCRMTPPAPPGPGDPATPNGDSNGYQVYFKWCLGQTQMVTDDRFAERVTHFFPDEPERDTWTLEYDVDCDGLGGMFAGWEDDDGKRQLADDFRELAGMPPVCRPENDLPENGGDGNGRIDFAECPVNTPMNRGEQEACITLPLDDFPHTVVGYKFYQNVGSHHFTIWAPNHECNRREHDADGHDCVGNDLPLPPDRNTWHWNTLSCGAMWGDAVAGSRIAVLASQKPETASSFPVTGPGLDPDSDIPLVGKTVGRNHIFWPSTHVLNKSYPQWDTWRSTQMDMWMNVYTADPVPEDLANVPPPTVPQYRYRLLYGLITGLYTFTPPNTVGLVQGVWYPPRWPAYVFGLTGHGHRRTTLFTMNRTPANPDTGHPDLDCRGGTGNLYQTTTPEEAKWCTYGDVTGSEIIELAEGQGLEFKCWTNNGMNAVNAIPDASVRSAVLSAAPQLAPRPLKWSCEQLEGVTPGLPVTQVAGIATVVPCQPDDPTALVSDHQPDAECCEAGTGPGTGVACDPVATGGTKGTGHCVPGHLTWGYSSDDEMCLPYGQFYDLDTGVLPAWPEASP